ncbi:hypothetical protein D3C71_1521910 [compost metagenome]
MRCRPNRPMQRCGRTRQDRPILRPARQNPPSPAAMRPNPPRHRQECLPLRRTRRYPPGRATPAPSARQSPGLARRYGRWLPAAFPPRPPRHNPTRRRTAHTQGAPSPGAGPPRSPPPRRRRIHAHRLGGVRQQWPMPRELSRPPDGPWPCDTRRPGPTPPPPRYWRTSRHP